MFTGIIENLAKVESKQINGENHTFVLSSSLSHEFKVDQSVSHNGVCLTVEEIHLPKNQYRVTAVKETIDRSNLSLWDVGTTVNLERSMQLGARLDGHIVQGHVDGKGIVESVEDEKGSKRVTFSFPKESASLLVEKGSICVDGISLTVAALPTLNTFQVVIIPYTWDHTNASSWEKAKQVNLEFDIIGKYILRSKEVDGSARSDG